MPVITPAITGSANVCAFLDMIAWSELKRLIEVSDNGYNVIVGSTPNNLLLFKSYKDHPRKLVTINEHLKSTAAGRYQLLARYYDAYKALLNLNDFSPLSQDLIAIQQIRERKALQLIKAGQIEMAIRRCSNIWASFPGNNYGQHQNSIAQLIAVYEKARGLLL